MRHTIFFSIAICFLSFFAIAPARAQWVESGLYGGGGGLIAKGTNLFVGTVSSGVFLSTDTGINWTAARTGLPPTTNITSLAVSGINLFAGVAYDGVYLSTNNGKSWAAVSGDSMLGTGPFVPSLVVIGTNLFAATDDDSGVFLSTNNGTSWTVVKTGLTSLGVFDLAVNGTNLFAGTDSGVFRSTNNGTSWTNVGDSLGITSVTSLTVSGTNLFAVTLSGFVFLSTDNGADWTEIDSGLTSMGVWNVAASGTNFFAGTDSGVFRSTDNGTSWVLASNGLPPVTYAYSVAVIGTNLFAENDRGLFVSTNNGISWTAANTGLPSEVNSFGVIANHLFAGTLYDVDLSTNNGTSWMSSSTGMGYAYITSFAVSGTNIFASGSGYGVFLSTDLGASWTKLVNAPPYVSALAASGTNIYAGAEGGVYLSTNNGTNWVSEHTAGATDAFALSGTNIFAGGNGVNLSTDNGTSWTALGTSGLGNRVITALAVNGPNIFAGTLSGVYLSSNNGTTWTKDSTGPGPKPYTDTVNTLLMLGTNLFAGTSAGVYLSTNNGTSWLSENAGLTDTLITCLTLCGTNLYAGTGIGAWLLPVSDLNIPALDTLAASLDKDTTLVLAADSAKPTSHRIDFVNHSSDTLTILSAALTDSNNHFSIIQFLPSFPDTVQPNDTFSMIVNFTGDTLGTVYLDTMVLSVDPDLQTTSYYVYLKGNSFSTAPPAAVPQNLQISSDDFSSYPNPFSQSTKISFIVLESGEAEVTIVNLLGSEIARLFSGSLSAGAHSFEWDAGKNAYATQEAYECLVRMNGQVETLPVVLMR